MPRLYSSSYVLNILLECGAEFISQKGSHVKLRLGKRTIIVPDNRREIPVGTLKSILRQSGLSAEDFKN